MNPITAEFDEILDAFEFVSASPRTEHEAFLCVKTGKLELWHEYERQAREQALRSWCDENGVGVRGR